MGGVKAKAKAKAKVKAKAKANAKGKGKGKGKAKRKGKLSFFIHAQSGKNHPVTSQRRVSAESHRRTLEVGSPPRHLPGPYVCRWIYPSWRVQQCWAPHEERGGRERERGVGGEELSPLFSSIRQKARLVMGPMTFAQQPRIYLHTYNPYASSQALSLSLPILSSQAGHT